MSKSPLTPETNLKWYFIILLAMVLCLVVRAFLVEPINSKGQWDVDWDMSHETKMAFSFNNRQTLGNIFVIQKHEHIWILKWTSII